MKLSRLAAITLALNVTTTLAAIIAWTNAMSEHSIHVLAIAGLLGLIAFSLMWVHFISDAIRDIWLPQETVGTQYAATRWIVLGAILLHPSLIVLYLYQNDYGLPPASYQAYVGEAKVIFVFLGILALTVFLAFECKRYLVKYGLWRYVLHANFIAMFAILIHGFRLGNVMESLWYFLIWCIYGISFTVVAIWWYGRYYLYKPARKVTAIGSITILAFAAGASAMYARPAPSPNTTSVLQQPAASSVPETAVTISQKELARNNGKGGTKCWLAVDGLVYDVSGSPEWVNGQHIPSRGMVSCGRDLTAIIRQSPHGKDVLGDLPAVGTLEN